MRDAVTVEPVAPLALKGKTGPVAAFRLLGVLPDAQGHARHLDAPMVGRESELALLVGALDQAVARRRGHLVVVVGQAGVGKARRRTEVRILGGIAAGLCLGPTPAADAAEGCRRILDELGGAPRPTVMTLDSLALCAAMLGRSEEGVLAIHAALLSQALFAKGGQDREAERLSEVAEAAAADCGDVAALIEWRMARIQALAGKGDAAGAERPAREAAALAGETDCLLVQALSLLTLARVLRLGGRAAEARANPLPAQQAVRQLPRRAGRGRPGRRGVDHARADRVDPHPAGTVLQRRRPGQLQQPRLGRRIVREPRRS